MDDELRSAFATLSAQMSTIASDVSAGNVLQRQTITEVRQLGGRVDRLEKEVFGDAPPPPLKSDPLLRRITNHDGELAELAGQVIAVKADVATVKAINEAQSQKLEAVEGKVDAIHKAVVGVVTHPKFVFVGKVLFGAAMAYAAAKGFKVLP